MFRVVWLQIALDELADAWLQGDSALRKAITAASHDIDQRLGRDPHEEGESRPGGRRLTFAAPLAALSRLSQTVGR
jgi:hypothetical protein